MVNVSRFANLDQVKKFARHKVWIAILLHFVAHGVLFENFQTEADERENVFTQTVILPNLRKIAERFELRPLVVRLYLDNQTDDEDFYWWSYPPQLNEYIVRYAKEHRLPVRYLE